MADEREPESQDGARDPSSDPAALHFALSSAAGSDEARAFLKRQAELVALQAEQLREEMPLVLSNLRFRWFGNFTRAVFEIAIGLVVLLAICGLGTMVWNAARDNDLVVDAFSVPADVAQSGMTGSVLAGRVLDRLGPMQASTFSLAQGAGSYRRNGTEQVRVEIPSTSISIGELDRYLREWLGHETHVAGDLVHTAKGYALTIRYGDQPGSTLEDNDLNKLIDPTAERLYRAARPLRYADYLAGRGRFREAEAIIVSLARAGSTRERALAYLSWSGLLFAEGDPYGELEKSLLATRLDPANAAAWYQVDAGAYNTQHREEAVKAEETVLSLIKAGKASDLNPDMAPMLLIALAADRAVDKGDFAEAIALCASAGDTSYKLDCENTPVAEYEIADHDVAEARRLASLVTATDRNGKPSWARDEVRQWLAGAEENWSQQVASLKAADRFFATRPNLIWRRHTEVWPDLAVALARSGNIADAQSLIAATSLDCDACVEARGKIAATMHDWASADRWFSMVSARTPSLPRVDNAWGEMLLRKGDYDAAITKFASAHEKGPHFADPLEMWGEALMQKNRSDLALAKFEEADKYAPNWGRLHLKWGEALFYAGKRDEAKKQFAIAARLDLPPADKTLLANWTKAHG